MKNSKAYIMNKLYAGKYLSEYMEKNETLTTLDKVIVKCNIANRIYLLKLIKSDKRVITTIESLGSTYRGAFRGDIDKTIDTLFKDYEVIKDNNTINNYLMVKELSK